MGTVIIVVIGILSYLAPMPADGFPQRWLPIFMESQNAVGWICAAVATVYYFFSDDWDETVPKIALILMDILVGVDLILKGVMWLNGLRTGAHEIQELFPWLAFFSPILLLLLLNYLWGKIHPRQEESTMEMARMLAGADAAVLGLSFILCYLNPVTNPYLTYKAGDFGFQVVGQLCGVKENFVPAMTNIASWPWQLKLLLGVSVILILESYLCGARRGMAIVVNNILENTLWYVISVYLMLGFFKLRTYVYHAFWYFFVELAIIVAFGMVAVLLPFVLLFPNTARVITSGFYAPSKSSGSANAGADGEDAMERFRKSQSVRTLPAVVYLNGEQLTRQSLDGDSAVYYDESRREYVITSVSIHGNSAETNIGYVNWY